MIKIKNNNVKLIINADVIEDVAKEQINNMVDHPSMKGLISIMPDVHAGAGSVIGFTGRFNKSIIANIVGVDIGCGVVCHKLGKKEIDFPKLDDYIRENIPLGFKRHNFSKERGLSSLYSFLEKFSITETIAEVSNKFDIVQTNYFYTTYNQVKFIWPGDQVGTLGGGNHFIEVGKDEKGTQYLLIHSGSRNFGLKVANFFQKKAKELCKEMCIETPQDLEYLPMSCGGEEYLHWMKIAQEYAMFNREVMTRIILYCLDVKFNPKHYIESVHNYIASDNIVRKGAIQAYKDQQVIIPLNMSDGTILGIGKGNDRYNYSAPHGAGRIYGRKEMKRRLEKGKITMNEFNKSMNGIFSTSVKESTIDESKFAYKNLTQIKRYLDETIEIKKILKPIYNLKSDEE